MHFDFTISLTTLLQLPVLFGVFKVVRFISVQKDFPPHRHINGSKITYPKGYAPEKVQSFGAGE